MNHLFHIKNSNILKLLYLIQDFDIIDEELSFNIYQISFKIINLFDDLSVFEDEQGSIVIN